MTATITGASRRLTDSDIAAAASALACDPAVVRAVCDIEGGGTGFLPDGRPKILFEAHHFSRRTGGRYDAAHPDISAPRWDRHLYRGGAAEHIRLTKAMQLDRTAALCSTSWGLFQVLGSNHKACGFPTVAAFVAAHEAGEGAQLLAFVAFIRATGLADELQRQDWDDFARGYNGPGYEANDYDTKLAAAFARRRREAHEIEDLASLPVERLSAGISAGGERAEIAELQAALNAAGASPKLTVDGYAGPKTDAAVIAFQRLRGLVADGVAGPVTRRALGLV